MKLRLILVTVSLLVSFCVTGGYASVMKLKRSNPTAKVTAGTGDTNLKPVESPTGTTGAVNAGDDLLAMESENVDQVAIQSNIAAAAVHYHYNNLPKEEAAKPQTYYYDHVPAQPVAVSTNTQQHIQRPNAQAELHEGNKYPLHSDVVAAGSVQQKNKQKPKFHQQQHGHGEHDYLDFSLPFTHNGVVNMIVEVFGAAIIPLLLFPLIGLGLLYLIWSETQKKRQHYESPPGPVEEYYFDNGVTYGKGKHSYVVGYDYGSSIGGEHRKINELTRRVLPQLNVYDKNKKKNLH